MAHSVPSLWVYLAQTPLLWLTATFTVYQAAHVLYRRTNFAPLCNPVLLAIVLLVALLMMSGTPYQTYFDGAQFVHFLLGPATVALAIPLYEYAGKVKQIVVPVIGALLAGSIAAIVSVAMIGGLLSLSKITVLSLTSKSITTPIAMGVSEKIGGIPSLTAVFVILTGVFGAVTAKEILDILGVRDHSVRGFAIGLSSHGIGTARAFQMHEEAGAFAGLGMALNGAVTALLVPLLVRLLGLA